MASRIGAKIPKLRLSAPRLPERYLAPLKARLRAWLATERGERTESWVRFVGRLLLGQFRTEWAGSLPHRWLIGAPRTAGRAASPQDLRPPRARRGKTILTGRFIFDGLVLETGENGNPWTRPSPSRPFAVALHGMNWLPDLLATPASGPRALVLVQDWQAVFGGWNPFSWSGPVLERRVFNLACAMKTLCAQASPFEQALLLDSLARQARHLLLGDGQPVRAAEQAAAAAVAGCVLAGKAGERLRTRALNQLERALRVTVLPDGGHASRSPEAAMELLIDLRVLDDALQQLGREAPAELTRAIDRLSAALRFFILPDGRLPAMQGGEAGDRDRIAAALVPAEAGAPANLSLPYAGYEKLTGRSLQAVLDAGAPATGPWSAIACAQPLALEVLAGPDRLIANVGWSARAVSAQALRLTPAGSCANVADASAGEPMQGLRVRALGHRLQNAARQVRGRRHENDGAAWLEFNHDGWARDYGVTHERRLYLDQAADELRGEDLLMAIETPAEPPKKRPTFLIARFQLHPETKASLAMDHKSVLLQGAKSGGWWLRNDAPEVRLEPGVHLVEGRPQPSLQVIMRVPVRRDGTARLRWKLSATES